MASLAYTLKIQTFENITNITQKEANNALLSSDNLLFDYSSSTSLLPDRIPLCSHFLSEDTIPDSSPYSSMELIPQIPELSEETEEKQRRKWNLNNYREKMDNQLDNKQWNTKPKKTVSTHRFQSESVSDLELIRSAPALSPLRECLILNEGRSRQEKKEWSRIKLSDNSFSNYNEINTGLSGSGF